LRQSAMICPWRKKSPFVTFVFLLAGKASKMSCGMQLFELCEFLHAACCIACAEKVRWTFSSNINFTSRPPRRTKKFQPVFLFHGHTVRMVEPMVRHKIISRRIFQELRHFSINEAGLWWVM